MSDTTASGLPDGLMAMVDDEGVVITLYKSDPKYGAVLRRKNEWIPLTDMSVLADLSFVGVQDSAEALYDEHDANGNLLPIKFYSPTAEGPYWPEYTVLTDEEAAAGGIFDEEDDEASSESDTVEEPLAASVTLASAEDLDAAIAAAAEDPDLRWYVERRVAALGLEADLPWLRV